MDEPRPVPTTEDPQQARSPGRAASARARSRSQAAERRGRFARDVAPQLARRLLGEGATLHRPGVRTSATTLLYRDADDATLAVLVPPGEAPATIDAALAHGLTYQGDRDLVLALPVDTGADGFPRPVLPTATRLPWIVTPIRTAAYDPAAPMSPRRVPQLARIEAVQRSRIDEQLPMDPHPLGEREAWVAPIVEELGGWADVAEAHRMSYRAWHVLGRQVLKVRRTRSGLRLVAGVDASRTRPGRPAPVRLELDGPATDAQVVAILAAADTARVARRDGHDRDNREAWLQARLSTAEGLAAIGLVDPVLREVPATRPPGRRAYIDLLGVDARGTLHLVETKLGDAPMLALQGLDYWIWLQEHLPQVVQQLRARGHRVADDPPVIVDYLIGDPEDREAPRLRYLPPQLEALDGRLSWRLGFVAGWSRPDGPLHVDWRPKRDLPDDVPRTQPPRYSHRLHAHLLTRAQTAGALTRPPFLTDPHQTVRPAVSAAIQQLEERGLAHRMLSHVRSSQRFALELFAGLDPKQRLALAQRVDAEAVATDPIEFEYQDPDDRLQEATRASPHATQVDVLLRTTRGDGTRHVLLIEVKLSEDGFNPCSAFDSPHNPDRDVCRTPAPFGGDVERCFQLRNHDREHRRRYDRYLPVHHGPIDGAMCPFASDNQPMRNVALAAALVADGDADQATFALCAPDDHRVMWRRWREVRDRLPRPDTVQLASLPASAVLQVHHPDEAAALAEHYAL